MIKSDLVRHSEGLLENMQQRRSVRQFGSEAVPEEVIRNCISIASSAPSGANMQPWTFVAVSDAQTKRQIRQHAEATEQKFYDQKITDEWKHQLDKLKVDHSKPFLEAAPWLICVFLQRYGINEEGKKIKHYYPVESVGIAVGFLISAIHQVGLATLPYTPAPLNFLTKLLHRSENERPFMILPVGFAHPDYKAPQLVKKGTDDFLIII